MLDELLRALDRDGAAFASFGRGVLADIAADDIEGASVVDTAGWIRALFDLLEQGGGVVATNPGPPIDSWTSPHTVIHVVVDEVPYLADTLSYALGVDRIRHLYQSTFAVERDEHGRLQQVERPRGRSQALTTVVHIEMSRVPDAALDSLTATVQRAVDLLATIRDDRQPIGDLVRAATSGATAEWLANDFVLLGAIEITRDGVTRWGLARTIALGDATTAVLADGAPTAQLHTSTTLVRSPVLRPSRLQVVAVSGPDRDVRFVGLFPHEVSSARLLTLPFVADKVSAVLAGLGWPEGSEAGRAAHAVLERLPPEELFGADERELQAMVAGTLELAHRPRDVRVFSRRDHYGQLHSFLVLFPRDRYNTATRERIVNRLTESVNGSGAEFGVSVTDSPHAWLHVSVASTAPALTAAQVEALEASVAAASLSWIDAFRVGLESIDGDERGRVLLDRYAHAFAPDYIAITPIDVALADLDVIEELDGIELEFKPAADTGTVQLRLYHRGTPLTLSTVLPTLQNLGVSVLDERPYVISPRDRPAVNVVVMTLGTPLAPELLAGSGADRFGEAFRRVHSGAADDDPFNRLVLAAGFDWREVMVLRAYHRYQRQIGSRYELPYAAAAFVEHAELTRRLLRMFLDRFDPDRDAATAGAGYEQARSEFDDGLRAVESLEHDLILRTTAACIAATTRTNYFVTGPDGEPPAQFAFKLDPALVPGLPLPHPQYEIFVYTPRVEGVHLRAGRVARGGIRYSDRIDDYRTEILQLMKAQVTKNAVIVPTGAKGGFVCKRLPVTTDRRVIGAEVVECYRTFIAGLLDLTDNITAAGVVPPARVRRFDGDDPYLVVAADKGTATFSDIANEIALDRRFWLGDAFASGGSAGYDHKEMGITAKGAWESIRRHFDEAGIDIDEPFTVVGIGDMSGDVFGNGMLETDRIKLVAAFDHRHIFLDPDPDPAASYAERRRLFDLPSSSWADYGATRLSAGGGVFSRRAKSIELSPQARVALGIGDDVAPAPPPDAVVRAILRAPASLLFNGGIGTFVKASSETHQDVGDKSNDDVRIDAAELRVRVVGEGGNLGLTQRARIEYAQLGGRVFSDSIDNSAGVNTSDHEVNIKILLDAIREEGRLTADERAALLASMTGEVAAHVLATNRRVARALTNALAEAHSMMSVHKGVLQWLEECVHVDRVVERLPSDAECDARWRAGNGLTAPELGVVMAYAKQAVAIDLADDDLLSDTAFQSLLRDYFPHPLPERYSAEIQRHRLRTELIAAVCANRLIDRGGLSIAYRMRNETGASMADTVRAHEAAWRLYDMDSAWTAIAAAPKAVGAAARTELFLEGRRLVERSVRWLLRHEPRPLEVDRLVARLSPGLATLEAGWASWLSPAARARADATQTHYLTAGATEPLALAAARQRSFAVALDILDVAARTHRTPQDAAVAFFALDERLGIGTVVAHIEALPRLDEWQSLARVALRDDVAAIHADLTKRVLATGDIDALFARAAPALARWDAVRRRLPPANAALDQLSVTVRELRALLDAS